MATSSEDSRPLETRAAPSLTPRGLQGVDLLMLIGLVLLACVMVMILSGWLGFVTTPLTGASAPPAGVEDLPPLVPRRLPAERMPPAEDGESEEARERWLASSDVSTRAGENSRFVVRRPVTPPASEAAPTLSSPKTLEEALRQLSEVTSERDRLVRENWQLRRELDEMKNRKPPNIPRPHGT